MHTPTTPHDDEAEQCLLSCILIDPPRFHDIERHLGPNSFHVPRHRHIWQALTTSSSSGLPIDVVLIADQLRKVNRLEAAGGIDYLTHVLAQAPGSANWEYYLSIVRSKELARKYLTAAEDLSQKAGNPASTPEEIADLANHQLFKIAHQATIASDTIADALQPSLTKLLTKTEDDKPDTAVPTGYPALDELLCGLQPGQLILVAGRPSMGKSSLAACIADHVAVDRRLPVLFFSIEVHRHQLSSNILCARAAISQQRLKRCLLSKTEKARLVSAAALISTSPLHIDDHPGISIANIRSRAQKTKIDFGLALIVVDYLQIIRAGRSDSGGSFESRESQIAHISRSLKEIARELDVPVLALSQLNRDVEKRQDHRPILADLRESGSLEQDSDVVILIHRPSYYHADPTEAPPPATDALLVIAKQRSGPTGDIRLLWREQFTRFDQAVPHQKGPR